MDNLKFSFICSEHKEELKREGVNDHDIDKVHEELFPWWFRNYVSN